MRIELLHRTGDSRNMMHTLEALQEAARREMSFRGIDTPETAKHVASIVARVCGDDWTSVHVIAVAEAYLYQPLDGSEN
jgi:hypothetical protein